MGHPILIRISNGLATKIVHRKGLSRSILLEVGSCTKNQMSDYVLSSLQFMWINSKDKVWNKKCFEDMGRFLQLAKETARFIKDEKILTPIKPRDSKHFASGISCQKEKRNDFW